MQGYLTLATTPERLAAAANLARSLRVMDPARPICLARDAGMTMDADTTRLFDAVTVVERRPPFIPSVDKLLLDLTSPFAATMFIDAECLAVKRDLDAYWEALADTAVMVAGARLRDGRWRHFDVARIRRDFALPHLVALEPGVFAWRVCPAAGALFQRMRELYLTRRNQLGAVDGSRIGSISADPFLAVAVSEAEIRPVDRMTGAGAWVAPADRARRIRVEPSRGLCHMELPGPCLLGPLIRRWSPDSPSILHFPGRTPRRLYDRLTAWFQVNQTGPMPVRTIPPAAEVVALRPPGRPRPAHIWPGPALNR